MTSVSLDAGARTGGDGDAFLSRLATAVDALHPGGDGERRRAALLALKALVDEELRVAAP